MTATPTAASIGSALRQRHATMSLDVYPDRPDAAFLRELADEIEQRAARDRRHLQRLEQERIGAPHASHRGAPDADPATDGQAACQEIVALRAELVLLRRAAEATERLRESQ
jgi:hypothetical protein